MKNNSRLGRRCKTRPSVGAGRAAVVLATIAIASVAVPAHASMLSGDALDTAADVLAWVVLIIAPIIGIGLFLLVHVLPEKIAEKKHHPQKSAIQTLCLLSLVFGGLLWPLAWLWAFTRPTQYRIAYGTEKADAWFEEMRERLDRGELAPADRDALRDELESIERQRGLPSDLRALRRRLDAEPELASANRPVVVDAVAAPTRSL